MPLVRSQTAQGVATVTLDSPTNRNALSTALIEELLAALAAADADVSVRVVVLTHTGPVFCSGADLKETAAAFGSGRPPINRLGEVLTAIWESPKPVVARLTGPARAGGLGLVAAADIAVCSLDATFAFSEVRIGVIPAVISATVLPRLSPRAAAELFLTGDVFDGARAREIGLVTAAVPADEVDAAVASFVASLVRGAPGALRGTKELLRRRKADTFSDELAAMTELSVSYFGSAEGIEGIMSFRDKRRPNWIPDGVS
ncbi:enoyl-CoA hydratase/isomerase family protein [Dactylosporangium aurantiacum]|uniref:Enoyl-CoA hydratase/isomerase family protein n=1 Tax=Dactylosporangium aurantiacum TaxID=35754 RepID=A0A9Q9MLA4_9ACTN|nr:enoyl-CoA hydratase-related protein [Dactylosporangium aurantiacum]MDG6102095.1 enoyl-CoA hydratase-related protein [Dactylosporangium aurantiacum]UWZ53577.1 enoyl-CoA hydratase/isomerase family protein [Dactylosporangium aurantiacum]